MKLNSYRDMCNNEPNKLYNKCEELMNYHVILKMKDGSMLDGIIEDMDGDNVIVLVGEDIVDNNCEKQRNKRQHGFPSRYRMYRRRPIPLASLIALSLLAYPYIAPPYSYPYPY